MQRLKVKELAQGNGLRVLVAAITMVCLSAANAELQDQGNGLVLDTGLNITWAKDANLFLTQYNENPAIVDEIIALTPSLPDPVWGSPNYSLSKADFIPNNGAVDGRMTWFGAIAWVNWLNSKNYGGRNDWRLPTLKPRDGVAFNYGGATNQYNGLSDQGFRNPPNLKNANNELGDLYYSSLGNIAAFDANQQARDPAIVGNKSGPFINVNKHSFWTNLSSEDPASPNENAWAFAFATGGSGSNGKTTLAGNGWAVSGSAPSGGPVGGAANCNSPTITGTEGDDVLTGTEGPDVIVGLGGNDTIFGLGGDDVICGGPGNDTIRGGAGNDTIKGQGGKDRLFGQGGRDNLNGGGGKDRVNGGGGNDRCIGETLTSCER